MKHLVKRNRRIIGFVFSKADGSWWYAFGRPSQDMYISFSCRDLEHGMACIEMHSAYAH